MIEVIIRHKGTGAQLGKIDIENMSQSETAEFADYSIRFGVERIKSVGVHQRGIIGFPRTRYNVLGLLLQALNTLDPSDLELDSDISAPDMARGLRRLGRKVQGR